MKITIDLHKPLNLSANSEIILDLPDPNTYPIIFQVKEDSVVTNRYCAGSAVHNERWGVMFMDALEKSEEYPEGCGYQPNEVLWWVYFPTIQPNKYENP